MQAWNLAFRLRRIAFSSCYTFVRIKCIYGRFTFKKIPVVILLYGRDPLPDLLQQTARISTIETSVH